MMNKENSEKKEVEQHPQVERKRPRYWLMALTILLIFGIPLYWFWKFNFYDANHQVPIICTVTGAEQHTSSGAGRGYSSSRDYVAFDTEECRTILLPIFSDEEGQQIVDSVQVGRKYEFMMGQTQATLKSGAREVFSYRGPVD